MNTVLPQYETFLRDAFGRPLHDGSCVLDADRQVGYIHLDFSTGRGPDSPGWDGWFSVGLSRAEHPLRGKVATGATVQLISDAS